MSNIAVAQKKSIQERLAERFGVAANEVAGILKSTAFRTQMDGKQASDAQMVALMIVADQYGLNPFTKEIYAYPDKNNGIVPVVGVDGWSRIMNEHPAFDGIEFKYSEKTLNHNGRVAYEWIECVIHRKDRKMPIVVREYFDEVVRKANFSTPWDTHPKRMHRHKAEIQCARVAFGFAGIYDEDEAARILDIDGNGNVIASSPAAAAAPGAGNSFMPKAKAEPAPKNDGNTIDVQAKEVQEQKQADPAPAAEQSAGDEPVGDPLTDGMLTTLKNKMEAKAKGPADFLAHFGFAMDKAPRARINEYLKWASA